MSFDSPGAVILLELRLPPDSREAVDSAVEEVIREARLTLESPTPGRTWSPANGTGPVLSGRITLEDPTQAFPLLHGLRTQLRAHPKRPKGRWIASLGRGHEMEASRLAGDGFRKLARDRHRYTRALTQDPTVNVALDALCRALDDQLRGWTAAQWQAIHQRDRGRTLQQIGADLGIAYQNVSKRLIAAKYSLVQDLENAASLLFSQSSLGPR
jgi:hypothetical protein